MDSRVRIINRSRDIARIERRGSIDRRSVLAGLAASLSAPRVLLAQSLIPLKLPISSASYSNAGAKAAATLGLFEKQGLAVEFVNTNSANIATTTLISGSADVVLSGAGELVVALAKKIPIAIMTHAYWGFGGTLVLSTEAVTKAGMSPTEPVEKRLRALQGLRIGTASASSAFTHAFRGFAKSAGVEPNFIYMGQPEMLAGLAAGVIDGFIASAPYWGQPVEAGKAVVWISGPKNELPRQFIPGSSNSFQVMRANAERKRDLMARVLATYTEFSAVLKADPDKVKAVVNPQYPGLAPATLDLLFESESPHWLVRELTTADIRHEIDFMRATAGTELPSLTEEFLQSVIFRP